MGAGVEGCGKNCLDPDLEGRVDPRFQILWVCRRKLLNLPELQGWDTDLGTGIAIITIIITRPRARSTPKTSPVGHHLIGALDCRHPPGVFLYVDLRAQRHLSPLY
jgi:hypothetical protein